MNDSDTRNSPLKVFVVLAAVVILLPLAYSLVTYVFAGGSVDSEPFLEPPEARFKYCVEDAEWMRFHHWELLKEIRNDVVRDGKVGDTTFDGPCGHGTASSGKDRGGRTVHRRVDRVA